MPSITIAPASGRITPASMRSVVVLPAPSGPTSPKISPRLTDEGEAVDRGDVGEPFDEALDPDELNRLGHGLPAGKAWSVASAGMPGTSSWVGLSMSILMR